jgi:hypothetical protein
VRGLSLLRSIPSNRTCSAIGIPWEFCVCIKETKISSLSDEKVISSAETLVNHINRLIKKLDKERLCETPLMLDSITSAQLLDPPHSSLEEMKNNPAVHIRVAVVVWPSGAQLEGIVKTPLLNTAEAKVLGEVNRINKYGDQSECVKDSKVLKLYCFCKDNEEKKLNDTMREISTALSRSTEQTEASQSVTTENTAKKATALTRPREQTLVSKSVISTENTSSLADLD